MNASLRPIAERRSEEDLLLDFRRLMDREEALLKSRDPEGLLALAEERTRLTSALAAAASARRTVGHASAPEEARLVELYRLMRARHESQARVVGRYADRNARALGVLAQAAGHNELYGSDGRVPMLFPAVA